MKNCIVVIRNVWYSMHDRCTRIKCDDYPHYGGRGIKICERWKRSNIRAKSELFCRRTFIGLINFVQDMKDTWFPDATIDRIDNDGDYSPENCRWITMSENSRNRNLRKVLDGTHPFLGGYWSQKANEIKNNKSCRLNDEEKQKRSLANSQRSKLSRERNSPYTLITPWGTFETFTSASQEAKSKRIQQGLHVISDQGCLRKVLLNLDTPFRTRHWKGLTPREVGFDYILKEKHNV